MEDSHKKIFFAFAVSTVVVLGLMVFNLFSVTINRVPLLLSGAILGIAFMDELKKLHQLLLAGISALILVLLSNPSPSFAMLGSSAALFALMIMVPFAGISIRERLFKQAA